MDRVNGWQWVGGLEGVSYGVLEGRFKSILMC